VTLSIDPAVLPAPLETWTVDEIASDLKRLQAMRPIHVAYIGSIVRKLLLLAEANAGGRR